MRKRNLYISVAIVMGIALSMTACSDGKKEEATTIKQVESSEKESASDERESSKDDTSIESTTVAKEEETTTKKPSEQQEETTTAKKEQETTTKKPAEKETTTKKPSETETTTKPSGTGTTTNVTTGNVTVVDENNVYKTLFAEKYSDYMTVDYGRGTAVVLLDGGKFGDSKAVGAQDALTKDSVVYIYAGGDKYIAVSNKDGAGNSKYKYVYDPVFKAEGIVATVQTTGGKYNLVKSDGTMLSKDNGYTSLSVKNGYLIAGKNNGNAITYDIYDGNLKCIYSNYKDMTSVENFNVFGNYKVVGGKVSGGTAATYVYDTNWKCIDKVQNKGSFNIIWNGTYLWNGATLRDKSYNKVNIPVYDGIVGAGETGTVTAIYELDNKFARIDMTVAKADGSQAYAEYVLGSDMKTYVDEYVIGPYLYIEFEGVNVMMDDGTRYLVWQHDGSTICSMGDWYDRVKQIWGDTAQEYGLWGGPCDDNMVVVGVPVIYGGEHYVECMFVLKKSDNYALDKAIYVGEDTLMLKHGLWYVYNQNKIYVNYNMVDVHKIMFNSNSSYYEMVNADKTYTVYDANGKAYFTSDKLVIDTMNDDVFVSEKTDNGKTYYGVIEVK